MECTALVTITHITYTHPSSARLRPFCRTAWECAVASLSADSAQLGATLRSSRNANRRFELLNNKYRLRSRQCTIQRAHPNKKSPFHFGNEAMRSAPKVSLIAPHRRIPAPGIPSQRGRFRVSSTIVRSSFTASSADFHWAGRFARGSSRSPVVGTCLDRRAGSLDAFSDRPFAGKLGRTARRRTA